jgi:uncharacterized glyoxalase superfamily protein PhnB
VLLVEVVRGLVAGADRSECRRREDSMVGPGPVSLIAAATVSVVQDVLRSVEHYRDVLGFHVEFTYGEPPFYVGVERGGLLIHLQAASETKRQPGQGAVYVFVNDVDALYEELTSRGARTLHEPKDYPYGMRDFDVHDLDGNQLGFGMESKSGAR